MTEPILPPLSDGSPEFRAYLAARYRELLSLQLAGVVNTVMEFRERVAAVAATFADLEQVGFPQADPDGWVPAAQALAAMLFGDLVQPSRDGAIAAAERFMNDPANGTAPDGR